jgi:tetratricopeptide (TPR) repeat protein
VSGQRDSLQDLIRARQQSGFFGRRSQVSQFQENLALSVDSIHRRFIFNIHGDAGVGKTYLTKYLRENARDLHSLTAYTDETAADPLSVMLAIADEFARADNRLTEFEKRADAYNQHRYELESDPQAPEGLASFLTKTAVAVAFAAARDIPIAGSLLAPVDAAAVAEQANRARSYIARKLSDHADVSLLMSPTEELTQIFVRGLNRVDGSRQIVLFFDTYERTSQLLDRRWLRDLYSGRYGELPVTLISTISGQHPLDLNAWGDYISVMADVPLEPFTIAEARQFLASKGIADESIIEVILKVSGRLPMWLATLADARPNDAEAVGDPAGDAVGRFLKWEEDPARRAIAMVAALPRTFNQDVLEFLGISNEVRELFGWLITLPFVSRQKGSWKYHDVVRLAMIRLDRAQSPNEWRANHLALARGYAKLASDLTEDSKQLWTSAEWIGRISEKTYHLLCADPVNNLPDALTSAVHAAEINVVWARQWATLLSDAGRDTEDVTLLRLAEHLQKAITDGDLSEYFTCLIEEARLDEQTLSRALCARGRIYRGKRRYIEALGDFDRAIEINSDDVAALASRGSTYRRTGRYDQALADLDRAVQLSSNEADLVRERGEAYLLMGRYENAHTDFGRAIELDSANIWSWLFHGLSSYQIGKADEALTDFRRAIDIDADNYIPWLYRGIAYQLMRRGGEALADFEHAIELAPDNIPCRTWRGRTYRQMDRYEEAFADLDWAVQFDPYNTSARIERARTYRQLDRYEEAFADLDRAVHFDPDNMEVRIERARTYQQMDRYEQALADLDRAVHFDPDNMEVRIERAKIYRQMDRYEEALADLDRAVQLEPNDIWAFVERGFIYQHMDCYEDAIANFDRAIEIAPGAFAYSARAWHYLIVERYEEAIADFSRAIDIRPSADYFMGRGWAYQEMGRYEEAVADFDRVIEIIPDDAAVLAKRGETHIMLGSYEPAKFDLQQAIRIDPDITPSVVGDFLTPAKKYLREGRPELAVAMFEAVIKIIPNTADLHNNYGFCLLAIDPHRALEELAVSDELQPDRFLFVANEVLALHLLGRDQEALALGDSDRIQDFPTQSALMWNIDENHVLQLHDWNDIREYLHMLILHIKSHQVIDKQS